MKKKETIPLKRQRRQRPGRKEGIQFIIFSILILLCSFDYLLLIKQRPSLSLFVFAVEAFNTDNSNSSCGGGRNRGAFFPSSSSITTAFKMTSKEKAITTKAIDNDSKSSNFKVLGVCGGIGSGKSTASKLLVSGLGCLEHLGKLWRKKRKGGKEDFISKQNKTYSILMCTFKIKYYCYDRCRFNCTWCIRTRKSGCERYN